MNTHLHTSIQNALALKTYAPSPVVDAAMTALVNDVVEGTDTAVLAYVASGKVQGIQDVSAKTEAELEKFWARLIVDSADPAETLQSFPYIHNYKELTARELRLLGQSGFSARPGQKALIIGSGPLPLSAYELHRQAGLEVDHVDSSSVAIELAEQVMGALNVSSAYYCARGDKVQLDVMYDVILVAALAGATAAEKQAIVDQVLPHLRKNGRILLRSARGARTLLYPGIASSELQGMQLRTEYHPTDYIINSVFIYGRRNED